jgi:hypothetical protein
MQLDDVWETKGRLRFARTELLGHPVVVFGRIELPGIEDASIVERPRVTSRDFDLTTLENIKNTLTLLQLYDGPIEGSNDAANRGDRCSDGADLVVVANDPQQTLKASPTARPLARG